MRTYRRLKESSPGDHASSHHQHSGKNDGQAFVETGHRDAWSSENPGGALCARRLVCFQVREQLRRVLVAIAGLQFQATTDNHTQDARNAIVELTGGQSAFLGALHQTLQRAVRRVRHLAGQQLVEDQSRAVNVRLDIDRLSLRLLWRHVLRRPDKSTCERQSVATLHSRQAEIHH